MKCLFVILLCCIPGFVLQAQKPVEVGDCTVTFSVTGVSDSKAANSITKTLYIKGRKTRSDLVSKNFSQSVIYNELTGEVVILKELNSEKYISTYTKEKWKNENKIYDGLKVTYTNETKTILGYECKKAVASLKDGSSFTVYYTMAITPSASENPYQFKDIPGFILEYETAASKAGGNKIVYTATTINFNPVPASKFEIPTSGYRQLQ